MLVEWEGEDSDGDLWEESWVSITELTADLRAEARQLETDLFGPRSGSDGFGVFRGCRLRRSFKSGRWRVTSCFVDRTMYISHITRNDATVAVRVGGPGDRDWNPSGRVNPASHMHEKD